MSIEACRTIARQRWGRCTAFRMGIVAGEIGARIVNPYRGKQASLFREGLRRSRPTRAQAGVKARELGVRLDWGLGYWEVLGELQSIQTCDQGAGHGRCASAARLPFFDCAWWDAENICQRVLCQAVAVAVFAH